MSHLETDVSPKLKKTEEGTRSLNSLGRRKSILDLLRTRKDIIHHPPVQEEKKEKKDKREKKEKKVKSVSSPPQNKSLHRSLTSSVPLNSIKNRTSTTPIRRNLSSGVVDQNAPNNITPFNSFDQVAVETGEDTQSDQFDSSEETIVSSPPPLVRKGSSGSELHLQVNSVNRKLPTPPTSARLFRPPLRLPPEPPARNPHSAEEEEEEEDEDFEEDDWRNDVNNESSEPNTSRPQGLEGELSVPDDKENRIIEDGLILTKDENSIIHVKAGRLEKLIEHLTCETSTIDTSFVNAFLTTYPLFSTSETLISLLRQRYFAALEEPNDLGKLIRLRVLNIYKKWLPIYINDVPLDRELATLHLKFFQEVMEEQDTTGYTQYKAMKELLEKKLKEEDSVSSKPRAQSSRPLKKPHLPPPGVAAKDLNFLDIHPQELARQLTLIEHELFTCIRLKEYQNQNWNRADCDLKAPNIIALTKHFNHISMWPTTEILKITNLKKRIITLEAFITVAKECIELHNYNGAMEIVAGLQQNSVWRLNSTWDHLPRDVKKEFVEMDNLLSSNFKRLRQLLKEVQPPCVHYIGMHLSDLVFIEDGNPENIEVDGITYINFEKYRMLYSVYSSIQNAQTGSYDITPVPVLQEYLRNVQVSFDQKELYDLSYRILPRGSKKETDGERLSSVNSPKPVKKVKRTPGLRDRSSTISALMKSAEMIILISHLFTERRNTEPVLQLLWTELSLLLSAKFPTGYQLSLWKKDDNEAAVHEWPALVELILIYPLEAKPAPSTTSLTSSSGTIAPSSAIFVPPPDGLQPTYALSVVLVAEPSNVDEYLRKVRFFTEKTFTLIKPLLIAAACLDGIHEHAEKYGMEIMLFPSCMLYSVKP